MGAPHVSVLLRETVEVLSPRPGLFVDATAGAGGHAEALLEAHPGVRVLAIDRDPEALELARTRLARFGGRAVLHLGNFAELDAALDAAAERSPVGILADLGISSMQIDEARRGFSFRRDGPLDMRMGPGGVSAADIVANAPAAELTRIFREYGEERMAHRIAQRIVEERAREPIATTRRLASIVAGVTGRRGEIDPATRVFQALRIEVNQELAALSRFLKIAVERLAIEGRIAVLSYHSLEDREVKETFRRQSAGCLCPPGMPVCVCGGQRVLRVLTRRPIRPGAAEIAANPRSRSARLRAAEKIGEVR
ncbi:MAG TPA: 16S rRNA (cytosine(1402)-N(4))-methyltransferase RsmH [Thermoanaerobaculia bacterium]|jgi:16S rRNA (cytosine1402-N4)-methyltransferase|nr:16S rRNA (cytosine(1402)-N(4))-methyltransferase RsmH [Thermoanaerobaculia bacterium]